MSIRCLVVDDEPLGRDRIVSLLDAIPDAEVVGECENGAQALEAIAEHSPDVVFLDVRMPGIDGFGVLDSIPLRDAPAVIFVTAYDEYAIRAFDVHACDYLLKPFDADRFGEAFRRAARRIRSERTGEAGERLAGLVEQLERDRSRRRRLPIRSRGRVSFLDVEDIEWLEAAGNYVKIHTEDETHVIRQTLSALETTLPADDFIRVHRSAIVNIARIREIQPWFNGEYVVLLRDGAKVTSSRAYRGRLQALME